MKRPTITLGALLAMTSACRSPDPGSDEVGSTGETADTSSTDTSSTGTSSTDTSSTGTSSTDTSSADTASADTASDTTGGGEGECAGISTFVDGKSPSAMIHVAEAGADGPGCGAMDQPCATIEHAAGLAAPGTAVVIHEGSYAPDGYIVDLAGTADAPIWLGGAPGEARPVIEGGNQAFQLVRARYLVVHDLEVRGATGNGINADDGGELDNPDAARFLIFRNLFIHDIGVGGNQDCLKLSGIDDYWVLDSEFARCGGGASGSAIDHVGCHHGLIHGNDFHDLQGSGNAIQCKGGSEDLEIRGNHFSDPGERGINLGGSTGFEFFRPPLAMNQANAEARDIRVIANVFERGYATVAFVGCVDCLVANNVIAAPEHWVIRILQETVSTPEYEFLPASNGRFINNIVYFDGQVATTVNVGGNTDPDSFTIATNLWYRYDAPGQSDPPGGLPVVEQGGIVGQDPSFVDPGAGDFSLAAGSPAIGAGTALPELSGDLVDHCFADPPSIGALEYAR